MNNARYSSAFISEVIELAWDDLCSFDMIAAQTGLSEAEVINIMQANLKPSSFRMWRKRVSGRKTKHSQKSYSSEDSDSVTLKQDPETTSD